MANLVKDFCLKMLPECEADFLLTLANEYQLNPPQAVQGNKAKLLILVLRHLTSEDIDALQDEGAAKFLKLYNDLGGALKKVKPEVEEDDVSTLSYRKLRQFKINGTIGDPGQKNCLSYSSLVYQINLGETQGYTIQEIYGGVIRAIEAGNPFRELLELEADDFDITKDRFLKALKSHFCERDPNSVFNDLRTAVQGTNETAHKFCCRCVALKKKVINMSNSERIPVDHDNLNSTFFKTIYTGLRQSNIRNELRLVLRGARIDDAELLSEVSLAQANEEERVKKMAEGRDKKVNINQLTCDSDSESECLSDSSASSSAPNSQAKNGAKARTKKQKNAAKKAQGSQAQASKNGNSSDTLCAEVREMTAAFKELATSNAQVTAELNVLKQELANNNTSSAGTPPTSILKKLKNTDGLNRLNPSAVPFSRFVRFNSTGRPINLCEACHANKSTFCRHCFKCGSDQHKIGVCPKN